MMRKNTALKLLLITIGIIFNGCMLGPDYERPDTAADKADSFVYAPTTDTDANDIGQINLWWQNFADETTSQLVRRALAENTDLKAAAARILQAQATLAVTRGGLFPEVSYNFGWDRSKISFNSPFGGRQIFYSTTYSQDISVSYVLDLFGKIRRAEQADYATLLASEADQQALRHTIIAQVVRGRSQIATLQRRLHIAQDTIDSWRQSVEIVERRYARGLVGPLDVRLARENLAAARSTQPVIEDQLARAQLSLDVLLGKRPGTTDSLSETLAELPDLTPVPVGLPAGLLDRRPDLRSAEMRLAAATSRVGVSIAQMFPDLTLTGSYGFRGDRLADILTDETEIYSAAARLLQPIFRGGQLRAQVDAARARVEEETALYAGLVLNALREVEDALVHEEMLRRELAALQIRFTEARAAHDLAWQRYLQGVESVITVLETQRRWRLAENELAVVKGALWTNRVDLFLALGGDWETEKNKELSTKNQKNRERNKPDEG